MQVKITVRYLYTPTRVTVFKKTENNNCQSGCRKMRTLVHYWWENGAAALGNSLAVPQKIKNRATI